MARVGIAKIGFVEQNEVNDQWVQQEEQERGRVVPPVYLDGITRFTGIDQSASSLTEELVVDGQGQKYTQSLKTVVRRDHDIALAEKYAGRPMVVHVWTVAGKHITIGTKQYPARMLTSDRNAGVDTREVEISVDYETLRSVIQ